MQVLCLEMLMHVCAAGDAGAAARKQRASDAGAKAVVEAAIAAFPDDDDLQETAAQLLVWL